MSSRPPLDDKQKVNPNQAKKYAPMVMSDASVYDLASMCYTAEQIAERFNVNRNTVLSLHGDAYQAGRESTRNLPRIALNKLLNDFMSDPAQNLAALPNAPVLLKAIELFARKYEGLGSKQEVTVKHEEKPSVADIKFVPLQAQE